jgi:glutamate formiminotransferase/formiminotetrahydrofolate cyclodeaminase
VGWYIEDYGLAQISINFTNYKITPPHIVFDETVKEAERLGLRVTGSELVGLIPKEALLMAGRYYLDKQGKSPGVPEEELIRMAVLSLGLGDVSPFDPDKKIIEYQFKESTGSLLRLSLREFANELSMDSPAPGGGSAAALCGALSAALSSMVANLTVGKKGYEEVEREMKDLAVRAQALKDELLQAVDEDARAFTRVTDAFKLPKATEEQVKEKEMALEKATKEATLVPLAVLEKSLRLLELARNVAQKGNKNSLSDAGVAGAIAWAAAQGAHDNAKINLLGIKDNAFKEEVKKKADSFVDEAAELAGEIRRFIGKGLDKT